MMRSTPVEFSIFHPNVAWDYVANNDTIKQYWKEGAERAKNFESVYTLGMRGFGDCRRLSIAEILVHSLPYKIVPLSEGTNIALLEQVIQDQTAILKDVYGQDLDVSTIPQIWALCKLYF